MRSAPTRDGRTGGAPAGDGATRAHAVRTDSRRVGRGRACDGATRAHAVRTDSTPSDGARSARRSRPPAAPRPGPPIVARRLRRAPPAERSSPRLGQPPRPHGSTAAGPSSRLATRPRLRRQPGSDRRRVTQQPPLPWRPSVASGSSSPSCPQPPGVRAVSTARTTTSTPGRRRRSRSVSGGDARPEPGAAPPASRRGARPSGRAERGIGPAAWRGAPGPARAP